MVLVSYSGREINAKLVYYGPGLSGKTTNLEYIYGSIPQTQRGKMVSMKTKTERTLFFDFLPVNLGELSGFKTRFLLYTVPGQVYYNATRKLVLKGVDAVVFVADSKRGKMDENVESLANLRENLRENGLELDQIPWVIQYNKRDLPEVYSVADLEQVLNPGRVPSFEGVATTGQGVVETFKAISRLLLRRLAKEIGVQVVSPQHEHAAPAAQPVEPFSPPVPIATLDSAPAAAAVPVPAPEPLPAAFTAPPSAPFPGAVPAPPPSPPMPVERPAQVPLFSPAMEPAAELSTPGEPASAPEPALTAEQAFTSDSALGSLFQNTAEQGAAVHLEPPSIETPALSVPGRTLSVGERLRRWLSGSPGSEEEIAPAAQNPGPDIAAREPEQAVTEPSAHSFSEPEPPMQAPPLPEPTLEASSVPEPFLETPPLPEPTLEASSVPEPPMQAPPQPEPSLEAPPAPEPLAVTQPVPAALPMPAQAELPVPAPSMEKPPHFPVPWRIPAHRPTVSSGRPREVIVPLSLEPSDLQTGVVLRIAFQMPAEEIGDTELDAAA